MVRLWEPSRTGEASLQNLTFAVKIVRYCGLWRTDGDTKLYMLYTFGITLTFILLYVKTILFCFSGTVDKELLVETLAFLFILTPAVVCTLFILVFSRKFTEIVERIRAFITFVHSGEEHWKSKARFQTTEAKRRLTMYYTVASQISTLFYLLKPILTHIVFGREVDFPIKQHVFIEKNCWLSFLVQYVLQIFTSILTCSVFTSLDGLCFNIIASCSHQLNVLTCMVLNIENKASGNADFTRENNCAESRFEQLPQSSNYLHLFLDYSDGVICDFPLCESGRSVDLEERRRVEKSLITLSEWHQEILKTAEKIAKLLNLVMLSHYLFTSITLCMFTFNVQNSRSQSQLISSVNSLLVCFFRIFLLCWISSELSNESVLVADAAYSCNWYDLSLSAKKNLIIMMTRAQRPVIIKAGPTESLSLETCKKLLESAYSYLNVLNKVN